MASPALPNYTDTPFLSANRPGVVAALKWGVRSTLLPTCDPELPYQQRDINEMVSRGWVTRFRQRAGDRQWTWVLTQAGRTVAEEMGVAVAAR